MACLTGVDDLQENAGSVLERLSSGAKTSGKVQRHHSRKLVHTTLHV